jgi:alpha-tubulin suppressor-like RCC1 family protein
VVGPTGSPPEGGSAPGIWTLEQAAGYIKQGLWPKPVLPKELFSWGYNSDGRLGQNDTVARSSPVQVGALTDWAQVSAVTNLCAAIKTNGQLWSWGSGDNGMSGHGDVIARSSPVQVGALTDWARVSAGSNLCAAVKTNGTLWSWGRNNAGQLGQNNVISRSSPVQVGALTDWSQASAGSEFCAAIKTNGTLWTWGFNNVGQLGQGTGYGFNLSSPVQVGALTDWAQVSAGSADCAAIKTNGTLWTWGSNVLGQLGQNIVFSNYRSSPVQVGALTDWAQVSAFNLQCAAIKTNGTLWSWGYNINGQLGLNDTTNRSSPVQVGALTDWAQVSVGLQFCAAIKTNGTLWTWGNGANNRLGQNNTVNLSSPVQVGSLTTWLRITRGFAIKLS